MMLLIWFLSHDKIQCFDIQRYHTFALGDYFDVALSRSGKCLLELHICLIKLLKIDPQQMCTAV